ncbi:MAG: hypothetical protein QM692_15125 [Thermomicrobiales bacterium]
MMLLADGLDGLAGLMPTEGQGAWMWVAGIMAILGGYLLKRHLDGQDKIIADLTAELSKTSGSLEKMTNVSESQSRIVAEGFAQQREGLASLDRRMAEILDVIAPRRRT